MKKISLLFLLTLTGIFAAANCAFAADASLSVLPSSGSKTVGQTISASVQLNPNANSICVVKGTLVFENTTCQSITVGSGFMAQVSPTCSNPSFTLGIAGCSTSIQSLLTVSAKAGSAGTGKIILSGVKVIGAGVDVAFAAINATYDITTAKAVAQAVVPVSTTEEGQKEESGAVVEQENEVVAQEETNNVENLVAGQQASLANSSPAKTVAVAVIILAVIGIVAWYAFKKKK